MNVFLLEDRSRENQVACNDDMDVLKRMFQKGEDKHGGGTRKSENNE